MAGKLIEINEAAKLLGVTPDALLEMRQKGEVHGYRDGSSWKFKQEEIDRVLAERDGGGGLAFNEDFDHLVPEPTPDDDSSSEADSVSILVSEEELGRSPLVSPSTIIGKHTHPDSADDIKLAADSDLKLAGASGGSDLKLAGDDDVFSAAEAQPKKTDSATGNFAAGSGLGSAIMSLDDDALTLDEDGELKLDDDSDDDMVLGAGSDVSLDPGGSGINITAPSDSGLSLEDEPLELTGSQVESLELPEDDDVLSFEHSVDPDQATQLKADEEFLLSPLDDGSADDSSDSGSQVIALEDSDAFDENAVTMLKPGDAPLLTEESVDMMGAGAFGGLGMGGGMTAAMAQPQYIQVPAQEVPYTVWNVLSLASVALPMILGLMLMIDLLRNMWSWDGNITSTSLMDGLIDALQMNK